MNLNLITPPPLKAEQFTVPPYQGQQQPMQQPMPEQPTAQPQGLLGRIGAGIKRSVQDPNFMDRLTIGLGGMTMRPNKGLMSLAQNRINQRQKLGLINEQKNRTIEALKRLNTPQAMRALQLLDAGGNIGDAVSMAFAKQKPNIKTVGNTVIDITDLNNPKVVYQGDDTTAREAKIQDIMDTFNVSRESAVSFLSNRIKYDVDAFGNMRAVDTLTGQEVSPTKTIIDEVDKTVDKTVDSTIDQTSYDFPALFTAESLLGSVAQIGAGALDIDSPYLEKRKKAENYLNITNQQTLAALKKSTRPLAREYEEISNILLKGGVTKTSRNAASQAQEVIDLLTKQLDLETQSATYDSTGKDLGESKEAIDELNNVIQRYKNILSGLQPKPRRPIDEIFNAPDVPGGDN